MNREETCIPQLLHKILEADEVAKKINLTLNG